MLYTGCFEQPFTRRNGLKLALSAVFAQFVRANEPTESIDFARRIPPRLPGALTGSQFAELVANMDRQQREQAICDQLAAGNLPSFLRKPAAVHLRSRTVAATIFVMPEYVAIGSDQDFLRIPMNLHSAAIVANRFGFVLPTKKMVDAIYGQATGRFTPQPLPAGPRMTSTPYYTMHNAMIETQSASRSFARNGLVAGHKKDVVLTNRLLRNPGRIAIYGWHRSPDAPIQPLSTVHGADYADYSHGIRLVSRMALIDGKPRPISEILQHPELSAALSDEGPIHISLL